MKERENKKRQEENKSKTEERKEVGKKERKKQANINMSNASMCPVYFHHNTDRACIADGCLVKDKTGTSTPYPTLPPCPVTGDFIRTTTPPPHPPPLPPPSPTPLSSSKLALLWPL